MKVLALLITVATIATLVTAVSNIKKCETATKSADDDIKISACDKPPCILKRKTKVELEFIVKPDVDADTLINTVFGRVAGLPLPFIGVDNTDACNSIYNLKGEKVGCPVKKGETYMYKNSIDVLQIYPKLTLDVHWALTTKGNKDIFCFEDCGSEYELKRVEIDNCKYLPCPLFMNAETGVHVTMDAEYYSESLEQDITVSIKGIKFSIKSNPEPCTKQRPCPIAGTDASFSAALQVPQLVQFQINAVLTWVLRNNEQKQKISINNFLRNYLYILQYFLHTFNHGKYRKFK
ncbi:Niemann-Pick type C-2b [Carabus blaptoides fortunei]